MGKRFLSERRPVRLVKIAPGAKKDDYWDECRNGEYICVGWVEVGDLKKYSCFGEFKEAFGKKCGHYHNNWPPIISKKARELWTLIELEPGDQVIANNGISGVRAVGIVEEPGYKWRPDAALGHTVRVKWDESVRTKIPKQHWYDTVEPVSAELYQLITNQTLPKHWDIITPSDLDKDAVDRTTAERSVRQGQDRFRREVLNLYGARCAISGCRVEPALEAAHLHSYTGPKSNHPSNGIALRADIHKLFDNYSLTIHPKTGKVVVRRSLKDSEYWRFNGGKLQLSDAGKSRISLPMLEYHFRKYKAV